MTTQTHEIEMLRQQVKDLEADALRYNWILDNCTQRGGGHGIQVEFFVPVDHEDLGCAISQLLKGNV